MIFIIVDNSFLVVAGLNVVSLFCLQIFVGLLGRVGGGRRGLFEGSAESVAYSDDPGRGYSDPDKGYSYSDRGCRDCRSGRFQTGETVTVIQTGERVTMIQTGDTVTVIQTGDTVTVI